MKANHFWRGSVVCFILGLFTAGSLQAEEIIVTNLEDGYLSWTNVDSNLYYTVQFKPNLIDETGWDGAYRGLQDIQSDNDTVTVPVSMFWRVVGNVTPQHTRTLSDGSTVLHAGYYESTDLTAVAPGLTAENIRGGVSIFGIEGDPNIVDTSTGDAEAEDILAERKAWVAGAEVTGVMPYIGQQNVTPGTTAQAIEQGYHDGAGTVAGDAKLSAENIRKDVEIFGVTGTMLNAAVPKTGQTRSYRTGDDGDLQRGVAWPPATFTDHGDGTVTHHLTGLMWVKEPHDLPGNEGANDWNTAIDFCSDLTFAGHNDWRLPNVRELQSLVHYGESGPALGSRHPFAGIQSSNYWSSTTVAGPPAVAWQVNFFAGAVTHDHKSNTRFVWPVRDGGPAPAGMVPIPAGSFQMGDHFDEGWDGELPVHTVHISAFHMDQNPVTKASWDHVYEWATHPDRGPNIYSFDNAGSGQGQDHPVQRVSWYDAVKWCNARSEMEGLTPVYYTSNNLTAANIYRTDRVDVQNDWVSWDTGYRLPTEAEWEYAARGGLSGKRFPWGDRIDHDKANYRARGEVYDYDDGPEGGVYHPKGLETESMPYTTPVDYFEPNNFNLHDMAGNVRNWTWDWYSSDEYERGTVTNPRGPSQGLSRVDRGGSWTYYAIYCRVAYRDFIWPDHAGSTFGFRAVLPAQ